MKQPELQESWAKTCLQLLYDIKKDVADVMGCNIPTDFIFCFLSRSLASEVVFPADVTFLIHCCLPFLHLVVLGTKQSLICGCSHEPQVSTAFCVRDNGGCR